MKNILTVRNRSKNIPGTYETKVKKKKKAFWKDMKSYLFDYFGPFRCCWIQLRICIPSTDPDLDHTNSVADPDPGFGIGYLFDPWIRDQGWEKVSIRIRDPG